MKKRLKRTFSALLILPLCVAVVWGICELLLRFEQFPEHSFYFLVGVVCYALFQWVFFRPNRTYIFGHELSHAIAAWSSGATVKKFSVKAHNGSVTVSKSNLWVALAPYIIPIYALLFLGAVLIARLYWPLDSYWKWVILAVGFWFGFHLLWTWHALRQNQPDLKYAGSFLSLTVIVLGNSLVFISLLLVLFPKTITWKDTARVLAKKSVQTYYHLYQGSSYVAAEAHHFLESTSSRSSS